MSNVEVYDRPATADRPPIWVIALIALAVLASIGSAVYFFAM